MTVVKLQEILQSEKSLTLQKAKDIIYELKNDCEVFKENPYEAGFYDGEINAFYICLILLDKVEDRFKTMGLRRRFDILADTIGLERTADPREILDTVINKVKELVEENAEVKANWQKLKDDYDNNDKEWREAYADSQSKWEKAYEKLELTLEPELRANGWVKAEEIFEELERETKNHGITYTQRKIAELRKKYESENTERKE